MACSPHNKSKYDALVVAVASGVSIIDWCKQTHTARSTVSEWQKDPRFEKDVSRTRRKLLDAVVGLSTGAVR